MSTAHANTSGVNSVLKESQSRASTARAYPFCSRVASAATRLRSSATAQGASCAAPTGPKALRTDSR